MASVARSHEQREDTLRELSKTKYNVIGTEERVMQHFEREAAVNQ